MRFLPQLPEVDACGGSVLIGQSAKPEAVACASRRWHFDRKEVKVFVLSNPTYRAAADRCRQARSLYIASKRKARNEPTEEHSRQQEECLEEWNAYRSLVRQMAAKQALSEYMLSQREVTCRALWTCLSCGADVPASVSFCQTKHPAIMQQEFQAGIEERDGGNLQVRCSRSRYGCAAVFSVLRDQQEDAGHYERHKVIRQSRRPYSRKR